MTGWMKPFALAVGLFYSVCAMAAGNANLTEIANKALVVEFYEAVIFERDLTNIDQYIGDTYIQHNPHLKDGKDALAALIGSLPKPNQPVGEIVRVIAEADLVVLHVKYFGWPSPEGGAVIDIFRVDNGKIVEHWDVVQAIPAQSANENSMF